MIVIRPTSNDRLLRPHDVRRAVASRTNRLGVIKFNRLPVIDIRTKRLFSGVGIAPLTRACAKPGACTPTAATGIYARVSPMDPIAALQRQNGELRAAGAAKVYGVAGCEFQAPQKCLRLIKVYAINFIP